MWLLLQSTLQDIRNAKASNASFTADQISADSGEVMSLAGDIAEIHVKGVLTNTPDLFARFFGGGNTTYPSIISALAEADANTEVKEIVMRFDSGGGSIHGLFDTITAMQTTQKPIKAIIGTMAASAAYSLASQADEIVAHNRASEVGSVGVVIDTYIDEKEISITSSNAPDKRPDITTDKGKATIVARLDGIADLIDEAIAQGRNTTIKKIHADFGQGGMLLANEALKRGMIDAIKKVEHTEKPTTATNKIGGKQQEKRSMDLTTLKANHPDVYAAAAKEGQVAEHDRVTSFIVAGQMSGDMKTATEAIKDGSAMTMTLQTQFMMAAANKSDVQNRQADDEEAALGAKVNQDDGNDEEAEAAAGNSILALAAATCNVELEGLS